MKTATAADKASAFRIKKGPNTGADTLPTRADVYSKQTYEAPTLTVQSFIKESDHDTLRVIEPEK